MAEKSGYGKGYGKRPLWQWILIYLVVAVVVYGIIYYFFFANKGNSLYGASTSTSQTQSGY